MPYILNFETTISSSHCLPKYDGKCSRVHGHNWKVSVICEARKDSELENNMVVDFAKIKDIVHELDHTSLNNFLEYPTAENIAKMLYHRIPKCIEIKIEETPGHSIIYKE